MELSQQYDSLYRKAVHEIKNERLVLDSMMDSESHERRGITLLIRSDQNYYSESDFHITVMSLISCNDGFHYDRIDLSRYAEVVKKSIAEVGAI